ncbi:MAG: ParB N-terminal domain-containing protein [Magnetococcus sp. THC-1_WYH]
MAETLEVPIGDIVVRSRFRKDMGDISSLAESIESLGLLQPVGIDEHNHLVFGQRRLEACRTLGWQAIPVRVINVPAIMAEHDENEVRKDFTPTERVAIGEEMEEFLGNRQGQRTDKERIQLPQNFAEVEPRAETREIAAKHAGFGNRTTYEQAKSVINQGIPELAQAMDTGIVSVAAAATLAKLPPEEQKNVVSGGKDAALERVRKIRETKKADIVKSANRIREERKETARTERKTEIERATVSVPPVSDRYRLINGNCADALTMEAGSIDWIITDPPYPKEFLPSFDTLGRVAAHILKPGGALISMVGQFHLPEIVRSLEKYLAYHWTIAYLTPGGQAPQIFPRRVNTFWKPVLCFVKGEYAGPWVGDVVRSDTNDNDKNHHNWGQSESGMADLMRRFVKPGETVLDPFMGGGTTGVVALKMGCRFVGYDVDADAVNTTLFRVMEMNNAA